MTDAEMLHFYSSLSEEERVDLHPLKRTKIATPPKKKGSQPTAAEICYFHSSSDTEPTAPVPTVPSPKKSKSSTKKVTIEQPNMATYENESDLEITKEVQHQAARRLRQMAQAAKRRPGLRSSA